MDQCSTIGAQRTGITFKLPVITFLMSMIDFASIEQNIVRTKQNSHRIHIQVATMWLLNVCAQRFRDILCNFDFRVWCSISLQVGAFFDPNYLLMQWESSKIVLVNPPKFDDSAQDDVETKFCLSSTDEKNRSQGWSRGISTHRRVDDKRRTRGPILNQVWISHCFTAFLGSLLDFARFKRIKIRFPWKLHLIWSQSCSWSERPGTDSE